MDRSKIGTLAFLCSLVSMLALAPLGHAGLTDAIKKKVAEKAGQKATEKTDKAVDKALGEKEKAATPASSEAAEGGASEASGAASGKGGKVSSVSTKFDFVPGDSLLFYDDFTQDELGEFPAKWKLVEGTFEVAERDGERWLRSSGYYSRVRMKVPPGLPEYWTLELDLEAFDPGGEAALEVSGLAAGQPVWQLTYPQGGSLVGFTNGSYRATPPLEGEAPGRHRILFMARGRTLKVYVDRQRIASVPELSGDAATEIEFRIGTNRGSPMIANVRFAEGCRPPQDMLAEGKLVTYGIHFATGSDVVMPESAPVLRQVASYMESHAAVRLKITGHTDNVGSAASNLELSKRRAASVAKVLSGEFGIAADRFETDGKGDTQSVASNAKPEGRARNRRVEFAKL
jgi:outer membrane protein OmpA-like peptidoglycan-associated protein